MSFLGFFPNFPLFSSNGTMAQVAYIATGTLAGGLLASNCASIWTMCYISIQRHRAIVKPLSTVANSQRSSSWQLFAIFICALLFNAPVWFEFEWRWDRLPVEGGGTTWFLWHAPSEFAKNPIYQLIVSF